MTAFLNLSFFRGNCRVALLYDVLKFLDLLGLCPLLFLGRFAGKEVQSIGTTGFGRRLQLCQLLFQTSYKIVPF